MQVLSRYTYEVQRGIASAAGDMSLIYNSFADSLMQIPTELFDALKAGDETILKNYPKELRIMKEESFLVNHLFDEKDELRKWYDAHTKQTQTLPLTILLSYRCNFACPYCFEAEYLGNVRMKPETQQEVVAWTREMMLSKDFPELDVTFFGGEPLIEQETLFYLIHEFRNFCMANNRRFEFGLITNGFHLKKELYAELKELGLKRIKITLDGDKERHDKQRPLRGGRGSFEVILKNLKEIGVLTSFTLGGNYDQNDPEAVESIFKLLDYLRDEGLDNSVRKFGFKPIMNAGTKETADAIAYLGEGDMSGYLRIEKELQQRNLRSQRRVVAGPCEALIEHAISIDPLGDIYPCGAFAGDKRASIGNVHTGYNENYDKVMSYNAIDHPTCGDCKNLAGCFGGCRWAVFKQKGDYSAFQCSGEFFEKTVPTLLQLEAGTHGGGVKPSELLEPKEEPQKSPIKRTA